MLCARLLESLAGASTIVAGEISAGEISAGGRGGSVDNCRNV